MKYNKLRAKIIENGFNIKSFCRQIDMKENSMYRRLNGEIEFDRKEIATISRALDLDSNQLIDIFLLSKFPKRNEISFTHRVIIKMAYLKCFCRGDRYIQNG